MSTTPPTHAAVLALAAAIPCDPRTAERILTVGPDAIRTRHLRDRAREALAAMAAKAA